MSAPAIAQPRVAPKTDRSVSSGQRPLYETISPSMRLLITATVMAATMMEFLDTSIVNVALPTMMGNMGATLDQIGWVSTGYIITNVIVLPLTGWLSDYFGRRMYLFGSIVLFTAASFGCGMSSTLGMLIFWRVIQGAGGAAFLSTAQATLLEINPPHKRAQAQATFAMGVIVAPTLGPTIGGFITDNYSWPWIFLINVPIGILAAILTWTYVPNSGSAGAKRSADFIGIGLLALGLGSLQVVLERGQRDDWFQAAYIGWLTFVSLAACGTFVWWVLRQGNKTPAVNLRIATNRNLAAGTIYGFGFGIVFYGVIFVVPQFLQNVQTHTAQQAGVILLPGALFGGLMMPFVARFSGRIDTRLMIGTGMAALIGCMYLFSSSLTLTMPDSDFFLPLILRGVGTGLQLVPLSIVALGTLAPNQVAEGAGLFNLFRQLGGSFGIAILTTILDQREHFHRARIVESLSLDTAAGHDRVAALRAAYLAHGGGIAQSSQAAVTAIESAVRRQSSLLAYQDLFVVLLVMCAATMTLLFLFQRPRPGAKPPADAH